MMLEVTLPDDKVDTRGLGETVAVETDGFTEVLLEDEELLNVGVEEGVLDELDDVLVVDA